MEQAQQQQPKQTANQQKQLSNREAQTHDVQIGMLKRFKAEDVPLTLRLMGGGEIKGVVRRYDTFVIQFQGDDGITHMLYKHGIVGFSTQAALAAEPKAA